MATLDIPAYVHDYGVFTTLVGGTTCISSDDGGATYMQQHVVLGHVNSGFNDGITFPATDIPGTLVSTSLVTVSKGTDNGHPPSFFLHKGSVTPFWTTVFASGAADWTEIVTPLTWLGSEFVTQSDIESGAVQYNPGYALLSGFWAGPVDRWAWWGSADWVTWPCSLPINGAAKFMLSRPVTAKKRRRADLEPTWFTTPRVMAT